MTQIRRYLITESVLFRKTKEEFGGLSNMASGFSVIVNDVVIPTVEHLYQACRFPNHFDLQWAIISEKSPMKAKWIGRANANLTRPDWDKVRFEIMRWVLKVKLSQNWGKFADLLLSTGDKPIVELTPKDKIWGAVKMGDYCVGVNALGRFLMELRDIQVKGNHYQRCIHPVGIPDFNFLDTPIGLICHENDIINIYNDYSFCKDELEVTSM